MTQLHSHKDAGNNNNNTNNNCSDAANDPELLKIPVIGSRGVGKTSLVEQFVFCECQENPPPTESPKCYYPVVLFNERVYSLRLIDCPLITYFPTSSIQEWTDYRGCSLRSASAFILVFDATSEESFQYIREIRDQIVEQAMDVPILIVANKIDIAARSRLFDQNTSNGAGGGLGNSMNNGVRHHHNGNTNGGTIGSGAAVGGGALVSSGGAGFLKRDVVNLVKKQWKGTVLVECSAKYNWRVLSVFKELMKAIDNRDSGHKPTAARAVQDAFRRNRCSIM